MPQITKQQKDNQDRQLKNPGNRRVLSNGNVVQAHLDARGERLKVVVKLNDGIQIDFPVPTSKEVRDRFFYKKAKSSDKPARPPNKFFIFRTMFQGAVDTFKLQVPIVSGIASEVWRKSSVEVKEVFTRLSNIAKTEHGEINPGYVYKPHRKQSHDTANKFDVTLHEKVDYESADSSPSPSSSTPSSPCTPTLPLWASYPPKLSETLPQANLSMQQTPHFNVPPFTLNDLSSNSDAYPATFVQPQQLTYLSFGDTTIQQFVSQPMLQSRSDSSVDQFPFVPQPDSYQFYQFSTPDSQIYTLTNDVLLDQNCAFRLQPPDYNNEENSVMRSVPLPYSMDYFNTMHHEMTTTNDNPVHSIPQFPQLSQDFTDVPESSIIPCRQHINNDDFESQTQEQLQLELPTINFPQNIPSTISQPSQYNNTLLRSCFFSDDIDDDAIVVKNLKEEDFN
ncbi:4333_t:CDS:1, partial [Scutellospora calospora]